MLRLSKLQPSNLTLARIWVAINVLLKPCLPIIIWNFLIIACIFIKEIMKQNKMIQNIKNNKNNQSSSF